MELRENGDLHGACRAFADALDTQPADHRTRRVLAETLLQAGDYDAAYAHYIELPDAEVHAPDIGRCMAHLSLTQWNREVADRLVNYFVRTDVEPADLMAAATKLLRLRYPHAPDNLHAMGNDPLLAAALRASNFADRHMEELLSGLRCTILMRADQTTGAQLELAVSIAWHSFNSGYAMPVSDPERRAVVELVDILQKAVSRAAPTEIIERLLALVAMYVPLETMALGRQLVEVDLPFCMSVRTLLDVTVSDVVDERERGTLIDSFSEINDGISRLMQHRADDSPHPRWQGRYHGRTHRERVAAQLTRSGILNPEVLVAGCGTGQHVLDVALAYPGARITAIDISRRTLGYAQQRLDECGFEDIEFLHGDLQAVGHLGRRFHVIEACDVLHHLHQPIVGWRALRDVLAPGGWMHISLASAMADAERHQLRAEFADRSDDADSLRNLRTLMLETYAEGIVDDPRFYHLGACRDLLFHVQEHGFRPIDIDAMCGTLGLEFEELVQVPEHFLRRFSGDRSDLRAWQAFEEMHPDLFKGMIRFWCRG